jgi:diguanylate cyclase (GGDEF)-like protein
MALADSNPLSPYPPFSPLIKPYAILRWMSAAAFFEKRGKPFWVGIGVALVVILGIIDYASGIELNIALFYLIPIFMIVWFTTGELGLLFSFASTIVGFIVNYSGGLSYSSPSIYVWNTVLRLGFYLVVVWLGTTLKKAYTANRELARTDYVTGAVSIRYFYELAQIEMNRAKRNGRPFTLAYIDLDNFKAVNDRLGHSTGDRVLRAVSEGICRQVRLADRLARLGGDEFALLLPETEGEAARTVINRIHASLVDEMLRNGWMVTFSMGVVTFCEIPKSVDDVVKMADRTMYSVKTAGKNGVNYNIYTG